MGIVFIVWFVVVYLFSSQTGAESTKLSNKVTKELLHMKDTLVVIIENYENSNELVIKGIETNPITNERVDRWKIPVRKVAHYLLFLLGGFILYLILNCCNIQYKVRIAIFLGMLLACLDEFHQFYSFNRGPRLFDVWVDSLGVVSGVIFAVLCTKIVNKFKREEKLYDKFQKDNRTKNSKCS